MNGTTIVDRIISGEAKASESPKSVRKALEPLTGRYDFPVTVAEGTPGVETWSVVLRIEGRAVSGDVFGGLPQEHRRSRLTLGGRSDWRYSFYGDAAWQVEDGGERWAIALCDISEAPGIARSKAQSRGVLLLQVRWRALVEARFELLNDATDSEGWLAAAEWHGRPDGAPQAAFRRIGIRYQVAGKGRKEQIVGPLFGEGRWSLKRALARERIEIFPRDLELRPLGGAKERPARSNEAVALLEDQLVALADAPLGRTRSGSDATEKEPRDWNISLVFDAVKPLDSTRGTGAAPLGRSYGFLDPQNRFRSRFGAIIHVCNIEKDVDEMKEAARIDDAEALERLLLFYTMHEIGHLLNLPHCWERDRGHRMLGAAAPGALSYSAYASRWPFGPAAEAYYRRLGPAMREDHRRRKRVQFFEMLGDGTFDPTEQHYIRHAPLDQIAQGGRTFLDDMRPTAQMAREETGPSGKGKLLVGAEIDGRLQKVSDVKLWRWRPKGGGSSRTEYPTLPLSVFLDPAPGTTLHDFGFQSGALQIVVRAELAEPGRRDAPERKVRVIDPFLLSKVRGEPGHSRQGVAPLPWLRKQDLDNAFGIHADRFHVQLVYWQSEREVFRSNIVELDYRDIREHPLDAAGFETAWRNADRKAFEAPPGVLVPPVAIGAPAIA